MAVNTMLGPDGRFVVCRMRPVLESVDYPGGAVQKTVGWAKIRSELQGQVCEMSVC